MMQPQPYDDPLKPPGYKPGAPGGPYGGINPQPQQGGGYNPAPKFDPLANSPGGSTTPPAPAPTTPPATPAPTTAAPWYQQADIDAFSAWAKNRYGQAATPEQLAQIGANSTDMASAKAYADKLAQGQGWEQSLWNKFQDKLQGMLDKDPGDVDTSSTEYQSQLGSFKRSQGAALERAKNAIAERTGGTGGGFEGAMTAVDLDAIGKQGDFEAQLASQQIDRQRDDLRQALGMALGVEDTELRRYLGQGQLGLGLLGQLLNNQQAGNRLGFDYAQLQNLMNNQAVQALLQGGL